MTVADPPLNRRRQADLQRGPDMTLLVGLQRLAGNRAVARELARRRSLLIGPTASADASVQSCGPTPRNCSHEERADYAAAHPHLLDEEIEAPDDKATLISQRSSAPPVTEQRNTGFGTTRRLEIPELATPQFASARTPAARLDAHAERGSPPYRDSSLLVQRESGNRAVLPTVTQPKLVPGSVNLNLAIDPLRWTGQTSAVMQVHTFRGRIQPVLTCKVQLPPNWSGKIGLVQNTDGMSFGAQFPGQLWSWVVPQSMLDINPSREPGPFIAESATNGALVTNSFAVTRELTFTFTFVDQPSVTINRFLPCKRTDGKPGRGPQIDTMVAFDRFRLGVVAAGIGDPPLQLASSGMYLMMSGYTFLAGMPQPFVEEQGGSASVAEGASSPLRLNGTAAVTEAQDLHNAEEKRLEGLPCP